MAGLRARQLPVRKPRTYALTVLPFCFASSPMSKGTCSVDGCGRSLTIYATFCELHYQRLSRHGEVGDPKPHIYEAAAKFDVHEAWRLYNDEGKGLIEVGAIMGVSRTTVGTRLRKAGYSLRPKGRPPERGYRRPDAISQRTRQMVTGGIPGAKRYEPGDRSSPPPR